MPVRRFTLAEANATLPFVERVVRDIVEAYGAWKAALERYDLAGADMTPASERSRAEVDELAARIDDFVEELSQVGCVLRGFEDGLVDFPAVLEGRAVCLCWRLGEPEIAWWHETNDGYAGRQALSPAAARVGH